MIRSRWAVTGLSLACAAITACEDGPASGLDDSGGRVLDPSVCDLGPGFTTMSTNPYWPLDVGSQWVYEGEDDGVPVELQVTVLDQTRDIGPVTTRIVEEREWEDDELLEVSWNFFAEAPDGTLCYFGEDVDIYEDDEVIHEGAWCAGEGANRAGIFMPAEPEPGMTFAMERAPGLAEDTGTIVESGPVTVPFGTFTQTVRLQERDPLDGDTDVKVFEAGLGLVVDGPLELVDFRVTDGAVPDDAPEAFCGT